MKSLFTSLLILLSFGAQAATQGKASGVPQGFLDLGSARTFVDSDTTPDVSGWSHFNTNTTGVTITDFDGAGIKAGQVIVVVSKGTIVYDVTSSGLICGSTNITTQDGHVTTWFYDGTDWRCIARMDLDDDMN